MTDSKAISGEVITSRGELREGLIAVDSRMMVVYDHADFQKPYFRRKLVLRLDRETRAKLIELLKETGEDEFTGSSYGEEQGADADSESNSPTD